MMSHNESKMLQQQIVKALCQIGYFSCQDSAAFRFNTAEADVADLKNASRRVRRKA
jgi:DNA-binding transcriptional MocR family regulator